MQIIENFNGIVNCNFDNKDDFLKNRGKLISTTMILDEFNSVDGIDIYKTIYDPNKALRIYLDFIEGCSHYDDKMIMELLKRQEKVKLTDFPTGIVTIKNKVIGQEIPFYEKYKTIYDYILNNQNIIPIEIYLKVLKILRELLDNEIIYRDVHAKNFLISPDNSTIKLIDFDPHFISTTNNKATKESMINNLKSMLNKLNSITNIKFSSNYDNANTLEEIEESIKENQYILTKNS